ncbi:hypothetical protein C2E20_1107 [Micractinium conductrix]|uniref:Uncharacterized protein n=1 Tax=Micractinium conductrix TaxID=554055 RepID=A0A2P6VNU4_9CHLO|nr:hypothetical protein C2E20_1107 [Micractinium conductrix]|eukprot:PSC75764.1 hypothetical protein C2E20_1107 [Micractinium conductrix]
MAPPAPAVLAPTTAQPPPASEAFQSPRPPSRPRPPPPATCDPIDVTLDENAFITAAPISAFCAVADPDGAAEGCTNFPAKAQKLTWTAPGEAQQGSQIVVSFCGLLIEGSSTPALAVSARDAEGVTCLAFEPVECPDQEGEGWQTMFTITAGKVYTFYVYQSGESALSTNVYIGYVPAMGR